jgi:hypothetical protein
VVEAGSFFLVAGFIAVLVTPLWIMARAQLFASVCPLPLLVKRFRPTLFGAPRPHVDLDTQGIRRVLDGDFIEQVDWEQLVGVSIVTTDEGPFVEDMFWLLHAPDGKGCPQRA